MGLGVGELIERFSRLNQKRRFRLTYVGQCSAPTGFGFFPQGWLLGLHALSLTPTYLSLENFCG
jgi:hypothetical protein